MTAKPTQGPWKQGAVITTKQTASWSDDEWQAAEERERRMVFSGFSSVDHGRSRQRVCICETKEDAALIALTPELLEALKLADALLCGANMNAQLVQKKVKAVLDKVGAA